VRLRPHVLATGNLSSLQPAYRPGYSTESALLKVVGDIERASGNGMCTVLLALDITAAFDAVNHLILYRRIESDFGVAGMELSWLRSFVSCQSQYVAVGSVRSETCALSSGVPQGSVLGPLLFVMYVSEIDAVIRSHSFQYHQYADDLMIYMSLIPKAFDDLSSLVGCSEAMSTWFLQNALLLNKTEAIIFGTRQRLASIQMSAGVSVAGTVVHFAEAVKLLGVTLDPALTFNQHVMNVIRACMYHTRALHHIRPLLTVAASKLIATSIVGARLDYCNSLLYGTSEGTESTCACCTASTMDSQCYRFAPSTTLAANKTTDCFQAGCGHVQDTTVWNPGIPTL